MRYYAVLKDAVLFPSRWIIWANRVHVNPDGSLLFFEGEKVTHAFRAHQWTRFHEIDRQTAKRLSENPA